MKIIMGGVRGSFPATGPAYARYGSDTTSVLIEGCDGTRLMLDLGTGARALGQRMIRDHALQLTVLLSHFHLDHLSGLPMLPLMYRSDCSIEFASPRHGGFDVEQVLSQLLEQPYWPLQMEDLASTRHFIRLEDAGGDPMKRGGLEIRWCPTHHEGGSTAYRVDEPATGESVVFATDVEWPKSSVAEREMLTRLLRNPGPAGLLLMDAQYTPAEYDDHRSWGHSSWKNAVDVAREIPVGKLWLTHHEPSRTDDALDQIATAVRAAWGQADMARQGMELVPPKQTR